MIDEQTDKHRSNFIYIDEPIAWIKLSIGVERAPTGDQFCRINLGSTGHRFFLSPIRTYFLLHLLLPWCFQCVDFVVEKTKSTV